MPWRLDACFYWMPVFNMSDVLLDVRDLQTYLFTRWGVVKAVDKVSFTVDRRETLGLVGESGCGKSMTCLSIIRLVPQPAGRIVGGEILFDGENLLAKSEADMREMRGKKISMILQDPMTSLNPVFTVGHQLMEPLRIHQRLSGRRLWDKAVELLRAVRISAPESRLTAYPHQFSGGMRQRLVGAMALACQPSLLIADEPTTSLDVTVQAQYLALLKELQRESGFAMIFITHDFGIVAEMCDRVGVMYAGKLVEMAPVRALFNHPIHPYTEALLQSVPTLDRVERLSSIEGQPPQLSHLPRGCSFASRCAYVTDQCRREEPPKVGTAAHWATCWRTDRSQDV
jgi:oligopeptide/dipeptide ABC transporter ATP-binding protein